MPAQENAFQFLTKGLISSEENFFYCQSRDQSAARLPKWLKHFVSFGLSENSAAIVTAILGELTNNSFDHNLGRWHDPTGCIVTYEKRHDSLLIFVVDRGQGIISSLGSSLKGQFSKIEILKKAFEERISGRAPEKRGNGLKFVAKNIQLSNNSLFCYSQSASYTIGQDPNSIDVSDLPKDFGTLIQIKWSLK